MSSIDGLRPCTCSRAPALCACPHDLRERREQTYEMPVADAKAAASAQAARQSDAVNRPAHYTAGGIECIDAIKAAMTPEQFKGYLRGNAMKYLWRHEHKGGIEDLHKAGWYLNKLVEVA